MMSQKYKNSYILLVKGGKSSEDKKANPFNIEIQKKMYEKILPSHVKLQIVSNGYLPDILKELPGNNYALYCGPDRIEGYRRQLKSLTDGNKMTIINTEELVPRKEGVSGTKFREALRNNDKEAFQKVAPKELWSMFEELKEIINNV
jgi:hypothetical protein